MNSWHPAVTHFKNTLKARTATQAWENTETGKEIATNSVWIRIGGRQLDHSALYLVATGSGFQEADIE